MVDMYMHHIAIPYHFGFALALYGKWVVIFFQLENFPRIFHDNIGSNTSSIVGLANSREISNNSILSPEMS